MDITVAKTQSMQATRVDDEAAGRRITKAYGRKHAVIEDFSGNRFLQELVEKRRMLKKMNVKPLNIHEEAKRRRLQEAPAFYSREVHF